MSIFENGGRAVIESNRQVILRSFSPLALLLAIVIPVAGTLVLSGTANASSVCYQSTRYGGYGESSSSHYFAGIDGDLNSSATDMTLYNSSNDHANVYIDNWSDVDPSITLFAGHGWIQDGYFIGSADGQDATTVVVYAENFDLNTFMPVTHLYPSLSLGNHYFYSYFTGETGYGGRGLYESFYSNSLVYLNQAYLHDPNNTQQSADSEALSQSSSGYCPKLQHILLGTNGNESSPGYNANTVLNIFDSGHSNWFQMTPSNLPLSLSQYSPYVVTTYSGDDAFGVNGGG
jgi:hypothetical protein